MTVQRTIHVSPAEDLVEALEELSLQIWVAQTNGETWDPVDAPADTPVDECFERLRVAITAFRRHRERNGTDVTE